MRLIGTLDNKSHAQRFTAYLTTQAVSAHLEPDGERWELWVRDEDDVPRAIDALDRFRADPEHADFRNVLEKAQTIIRAQERQLQKARKNVVPMQAAWRRAGSKRAPLTIVLIVLSVLVTMMTGFAPNRVVYSSTFRALAFNSLPPQQALRLEQLHPNADSLAFRTASLRKGELWRLVTPIFLHIGPIHLLFNMIMLFFFGREVENRYGTFWFAMLVLACAIPSNFMEGVVPGKFDGHVPGPDEQGYLIAAFGGFSGVIYGLFGFVWMRAWFDPSSRMYMPQSTVVILVAWMFLGFTGLDTVLLRINMANWAHGVGLLVGLTAGYFPKFVHDLGFTRKKADRS